MSKAVFGITHNVSQTDAIVDQLTMKGFSPNDISVLMSDQSGTKDFAHEKNTKAPEGAATGATAGGAVGATIGLLAGAGALAIPGFGPLIAAGPIMAALSGAAVGATVGGISGAIVGMGIPEYEARRYEGKLKEGNILISVHAKNDERIRMAKEVLEKGGAEDISTSCECTVSEENTTH